MALTEKQKEDIAARKAINEAKRAKKPANKQTKKAVEDTKVITETPPQTTVTLDVELGQGTMADPVMEEKLQEVKQVITEQLVDKLFEHNDWVKPSQEALQGVLEQEATNVLPEGENVSTASVDSLELIPNDVGLEKVYTYNPKDVVLTIAGEEIKGFSGEEPVTISQLGTDSGTLDILSMEVVEPDCSIDFTNGRSKPAMYIVLGGYGTKEGTYFNEMMKEVVYILTLGGKFDRSVAPRFSGLPFSCKMKVPVDKYSDYVNRVGYPDYEVDKETYKVSLSAPDFRVLLNSLEKYVENGWELDPKQAVMYKGRYVIPFRLRFPVKITAGLHCKVRTPIKYTVEELREMQWGQVRAIANLHGIEETNHNAVISQLMTIMENIDG